MATLEGKVEATENLCKKTIEVMESARALLSMRTSHTSHSSHVTLITLITHTPSPELCAGVSRRGASVEGEP